MAKQDDGLFLLEVLIDKIVFVKSPCFSDKDFRTCVNIECPSVEPLEICDDDPGACIAKSGGPFVKAFNNGKSCLFSLKEADISKAMSKFPIKITVYKSLPCGCLPTKIIMGEATIDMTKEFVQARKKFLEDPTSVSYQALKDSFRIVGPDGAESGEVVMFLRISCFGKLIITRFQGGGGPPNLGATGGGSAIVDRSCNPQKDFQTKDDPCACGVARLGAGGAGGGMGGPSGGGGFGVCPTTHDTYDSMPCQDPDDPCYCSGPKPQSKQAMACRNTDQYCLHVPKDCCPTGNKVIFQVPTDSCGNGHKQRAHFTFTSDGVGDMARDEPGHLMPTTAEDYPGVVYDFPKQVIKLRIGKYIEMPGRKSKLEYQFITPVISHEKEVPVNDTRTAQCNLPSLPLYEELTEERKQEIRNTGNNTADLHVGNHVIINMVNRSEHKEIGSQSVSNAGINVILTKKSILSTSKRSSHGSFSSLSTSKSKKLSFFSDTATYDRKKYYRSHENQEPCDVLFGKKETTVYNMSLFNNFDRHRTSGTQATASVNKCLQVCSDLHCTPRSTSGYSGYCYTFNTSLAPTDIQKRANQGVRYQDVYFFGRKKVEAKSSKTGMGSAKSSHANLKKSSAKIIGNASIQAKSPSSTAAAQTRAKGSSAGTLTGRAVSIKDEKPCPALAGTKGDMVATVSHIRIGPREPCPVHGKEPCQGPKCIVALSGEEQGPVKVTTMTNPRRGVFELVIRRMTGAPLAKNELLLEWTPPPSRPPPCGPPCPKPCSPPGACRPIKCKMIVCRPSPCKPKGCVKGCKKPCGPMPCRAVPCKKCCKSSCCGKPCRPCKPCPPPPKCRPCPPSPCAAPCSPPCCSRPCSMPCKSSPCLRPCPVSYKKTRKARSQPKMKSRRKRISPCCNRSKTCPVVRCRSMPGPCLACCGAPPCPPRKCCSIAPCKPKCCKSSCSTCCP